jgi:membrane associated rhomboid family serine protease
LIPIPISDENPASRRPYIVYLLIAANAVAWFLQLAHGVDRSVLDYGAIPGLVLHGARDATVVVPSIEGPVREAVHQLVPWPFTVLTSMFMHGSWLHIIGNMWFLWIFGDNIEDHLGHFRYLLFYLACGVAAAITHIIFNLSSNEPTVGASGAIAGVMGAYVILYPRARVLTLVFFFLWWIPAWVFLGYWFLIQFLSGAAMSVAETSRSTGGIAFWAHVGGFVAGILLIKILPQRARRYRYGSW